MKIEGVKKLLRQLDDLPQETHDALVKSVTRSVKYGEAKARSVAPVLTGDLVSKFSSHVHVDKGKKAIYGFVNFHDGTKEAAIKAGSVNYGRSKARRGTGSRIRLAKGVFASAATGDSQGYHFIETVKILIGKRHQRAVSRQIKKAIKEALNG